MIQIVIHKHTIYKNPKRKSFKYNEKKCQLINKMGGEKSMMKLRQFLRNKRAQLDLSTVGALAAFFIVIIVTVMIYWNIAGSITGPTAAANTSINTTNSMFGTVFGLLPILGLVVVAAIIIGVVINGFVGGGGKPGE